MLSLGRRPQVLDPARWPMSDQDLDWPGPDLATVINAKVVMTGDRHDEILNINGLVVTES